MFQKFIQTFKNNHRDYIEQIFLKIDSAKAGNSTAKRVFKKCRCNCFDSSVGKAPASQPIECRFKSQHERLEG
jgi:hypothetical protein